MLSPAFPPLAARPGSAGIPTSGMDLKVVDDEGVEVPTGTLGNIVLGSESDFCILPSWRVEFR